MLHWKLENQGLNLGFALWGIEDKIIVKISHKLQCYMYLSLLESLINYSSITQETDGFVCLRLLAYLPFILSVLQDETSEI